MTAKKNSDELEAYTERVGYIYLRMDYEEYKSKSVEELSRLLRSSGSSERERHESCLALGYNGTDQAKEALGSVFTTLIPRSTDGELCPYEIGVRDVASDVLKDLGPPAPKSLTNESYPTHPDKKKQITDLLAAISEKSTKKEW